VKKVEMKNQTVMKKQEQLTQLKSTLTQNDDDLNFLINQKNELLGIQIEKEAELAQAEEAQVTAFKALGEPLVASPEPKTVAKPQEQPVLSDSDSEYFDQDSLSDSESEPEPEPEPSVDSDPEPPSFLDEVIIRKPKKEEVPASSLRRRISIKSSSDLETIDEDEILTEKIVGKKDEVRELKSGSLASLKSSGNETDEDEIMMKKLLKEEEEERIFKLASEKLMKKRREEENMRMELELKKLEEDKKRIDEESGKQKEEEKKKLEADVLKTKEETGQADFRNLLKKRTASFPLKEEKKDDDDSQKDFRNLLKKRNGPQTGSEEKKDEAAQIDFRHLLKKKT